MADKILSESLIIEEEVADQRHFTIREFQKVISRQDLFCKYVHFAANISTK